jgi:hypothetical protein
MVAATLTNELADLLYEARNSAFAQWIPRVNRPEQFDQQQAFVEGKDLVAFALG